MARKNETTKRLRYRHTPGEAGSIVTLPAGAVLEVAENPVTEYQITAENAAILVERGLLVIEEVDDG